MNFREATMDDLPQLLEIEQKVVDYERPFNLDIKPEKAAYYDIPDLISDTDSHLIVLDKGGNILATGYALIRESKPYFRHDNHCYMGFMFVDPTLRGEGVNQALVQQLILWSKGKGVDAFYLDVYSENESAIKAYGKLGFESSKVEMKLTP